MVVVIQEVLLMEIPSLGVVHYLSIYFAYHVTSSMNNGLNINIRMWGIIIFLRRYLYYHYHNVCCRCFTTGYESLRQPESEGNMQNHKTRYNSQRYLNFHTCFAFFFSFLYISILYQTFLSYEYLVLFIYIIHQTFLCSKDRYCDSLSLSLSCSLCLTLSLPPPFLSFSLSLK